MIKQQQVKHDSELDHFEAEQAAPVRTILADLPERQQVCMMQRSLGCSYKEIAEITGIPITTIDSLLARAVQTFRRRYHE